MSRLVTYLIASFVALSAFADEIDAEILQNLDFFEKMAVVEELDLIELQIQTGAGSESSSKGDGL